MIKIFSPPMGIVIAFLVFLFMPIPGGSTARGAPPVFDPIGVERSLNSNLFVEEGEIAVFTITAADPDDDPITISAEDTESWMHFDPDTGQFSANMPAWSDDTDTRINGQPGVFDITFRASDGEYTVDQIVSLYLLDSNWTEKPLAELVAERPVQAGSTVGTAVTLRNVTDTIIWSDYGGGKNLRMITFGFTGQTPDIAGWESDWAAETNYAYLPLNGPAVENAGAMVEGEYAGTWGEHSLAERACAELDIPVLIINRDWYSGQAGDLMNKYDSKAQELRAPEYLFYVFAAAHYLRSADALITVIDTMTDWPVSYDDFQVVFTGHSKFGHTCYTAAAADPDRVVGAMISGYGFGDSAATRLLYEDQGAVGSGPESSRVYRGVMQNYYVDTLSNLDQMNPDFRGLVTEGSADSKGPTFKEGYCPKYHITASEGEFILSHRLEYIHNLRHTTKSPEHSTCWPMWLAHCFLDRPLSSIDSISHTSGEGYLEVSAAISGAPAIEAVRRGATDEEDTVYYTAWDQFTTYSISEVGGIYRGRIPPASTAYYVEVRDLADGITGLISTPPRPTDCNYPLLPLPPGVIGNFQATVNPPYIDLTWTNPDSEDFSGTVIRYATDDYPEGPTDGILIYDGTGTGYSHPTGNNTYYYSAFTYDTTGDYSEKVTVSLSGPISRPMIEKSDYDGDGSSDIAIFRPDSGLWAVRGLTRFYFGTGGDIPVPGDYDGNGTAGIGVFRGSSGLWAIRGLTRFYFGTYLDRPVPGDYDGDGRCDMGIFRSSGGLWAIRGITRSYFGAEDDEPVPGDYNGNDIARIGIFRPDSGLWAIRGLTRIYFGGDGDEPIPGDYGGAGSREIAVFRSSSGLWAVRNLTRVYFGGGSDQPVPGDYDGNLLADQAIYRDMSGLWAVKGLTRAYYGGNGDIPMTR